MLTFLQFGFLYFPTDKTEYIPVVMELIVFVIICLLVFKWIKSKSAKDALKAKEIEDRVMKARREEIEKQSTQN
jgi:uncharacterized membrane protein